MQLGRVTGTIVSTQKDEGLGGMKLLVVQALNLKAEPTGSYVVAVDAIGVGMGEVVLVVQGSSARMATLALNKPVDASIIAVVDEVEVEGELIYEKAREAGAAGGGR